MIIGVICGVVVTLAAVMALGWYKANEFADDLKATADGSGPSAPEAPAEKASVIASTTLTNIDDFDHQREAILAEILKRFAADGFEQSDYRMYQGRSIELASPTMSATAILDRNSAKNTYLTLSLDQSAALSQVDIAARPRSEAFNNLTDRINKVHAGTAKPSADEDVLIQSKFFDQGVFRDTAGNAVVAANGTPTQIISAMSQRERTNTVYTFQWDNAADKSKGDWRLITAAEQPSDTGYVNPLEVAQISVGK